MKKLFIAFFLVGIGFFTSLEASPNPTTIIFKSTETTQNIFFTDAENDILFLDFALLSDKIQSIVIKRKKKTILQEDTSNVASHSIYELDLQNLKKGKYIIELHTESQQIIQKTIQIK